MTFFLFFFFNILLSIFGPQSQTLSSSCLCGIDGFEEFEPAIWYQRVFRMDNNAYDIEGGGKKKKNKDVDTILKHVILESRHSLC